MLTCSFSAHLLKSKLLYFIKTPYYFTALRHLQVVDCSRFTVLDVTVSRLQCNWYKLICLDSPTLNMCYSLLRVKDQTSCSALFFRGLQFFSVVRASYVQLKLSCAAIISLVIVTVTDKITLEATIYKIAITSVLQAQLPVVM